MDKKQILLEEIALLILRDDGDNMEELMPLARRIFQKVKRHLTPHARDAAKSVPAELHCPRCKTIIDVHVVQTPRP